MIREALRSVKAYSHDNQIIESSSYLAFNHISKSDARSVSEGIIEQSKILWPSIKAVIQRSYERRTATIFEGVNLLATQVFGHDGVSHQSGLQIIFVTLYLKDELKHVNRIRLREFDKVSKTNEQKKYTSNIDYIRQANDYYKNDSENAASKWPEYNIIIIDNSINIEYAVDIIQKEIQRIVNSN